MASSHSQREPLPPQQFPGKSQAGASKRYPKIRGPKPARHIPWPEIFKHHISLVEGHLKMIEMVRKHTVEGSGNYNTMSDLVKRSKDMLYQAKTVARTFIPPPDLMEQVPLGSSSDSMYPGYSPANHEYGKAAEEFGRYASAAKQKGIDLKADGIDYKVGQSKGLGHMTLAQIRAANAGEGGTASSASNVGMAAAAAAAPKTSKVSEKKGEGEPNTAAEKTPTAGDPMFFMDPNPTPLNLSTAANSSAKRKATPEPPLDANTSKKQKKKHGEAPKPDEAQEPVEPVRIEYDDISGEVDARLAEKEERRKLKEQRREEKKNKNKRKRDSEGSVSGAVAAEEKPKKKKVKPEEDETKIKKRDLDKAGEVETEGAAEKKGKKIKASDEIGTKKRSSDEGLETGEMGESKKRKKQKRVKTEAA
ncbi:MAG: hypothetical protein Q9197_001493 [Variospora fuerteventurae]